MSAKPAIKWERTRSCGDRAAYWGTSGDYVLAVISRDAGGWYVWLPGLKRSLGVVDLLRDAKAQVETHFRLSAGNASKTHRFRQLSD